MDKWTNWIESNFDSETAKKLKTATGMTIGPSTSNGFHTGNPSYTWTTDGTGSWHTWATITDDMMKYYISVDPVDLDKDRLEKERVKKKANQAILDILKKYGPDENSNE